MQCKTCGREISDTAKFCPYCGSKTEPPHNSTENKTAETAYETTANTNSETAYETTTNTNAESAYGTEANKNTESAYKAETNKNAESAYGTKTNKTSETNREAFESNTGDRFQTTSAGGLGETKKFLQIGFFILAALCFVMAFRNLLSGIQNFSYSIIMQGLGNLLNMVCYAGIAAILIMIALSKEKQRIKTFFIILSGLAAIIALCGIIEFITSMFRSFRYYFSFDTFFWILSSLLLTLTIMAAVVGITYTLLHLSGSTPDLSNIVGVIGGSAHSSQTSKAAQGNPNKETNYQNAGTDHMNQNSKTNYESQAGSTNYEGQNMGTNYNNQGTNYNNQSTNYNNQGSNYNYQSSGPNYSGSGVTPLKTDRGLLGYIVLSILTCGIYSYYFIYTVARDVNTACAGDGKSTGGLVQFILLSILTCGIYSWWWQYSLGNRLAANAPRYGLSFTENGTTILLWLLFGSFLCFIGPFIAMNIIIKNTNSICMAYNRYNGLI